MILSGLRAAPISLLFLSAAVVACKDSPTAPKLPGVDDNAKVVFTSGLDGENGGKGAENYNAFADWNVVDGCVDLHGNGFFDVQPGNGLYIDLDGSCSKAGTIESKTAYQLEPGTYVLEFYLAGNQQIDAADSVVVSLGDLFQKEIRLERREPFKLFTQEIQVGQATSAKVRFAHAGADKQGILLDLVRLRRK